MQTDEDGRQASRQGGAEQDRRVQRAQALTREAGRERAGDKQRRGSVALREVSQEPTSGTDEKPALWVRPATAPREPGVYSFLLSAFFI